MHAPPFATHQTPSSPKSREKGAIGTGKGDGVSKSNNRVCVTKNCLPYTEKKKVRKHTQMIGGGKGRQAVLEKEMEESMLEVRRRRKPATCQVRLCYR